jgi:hypothetical protein
VAQSLFREFIATASQMPWEQACGQIYFLQDEVLKGPSRGAALQDHEFLQLWWGSVEALGRAYRVAVDDYNRRPFETEHPKLPLHIVSMWTGFAGYLAVGFIPKPISQVVSGQGRPPPGPTERRDILLAVTYRLAYRPEGVQLGASILRIENDNAPIQTLIGWYEAKKQTIQEWVRRYRNDLPVEFARADFTPETLPVFVKRAGKRYRKWGRSHNALDRRN